MINYKYHGKDIMFSLLDNNIFVSSLGEGIHKRMSVYDSDKYTFALRKNGIYAKDRGEGLEKFMTKCVKEDFGMCWVRDICDFVLENGKVLR